MSTTDLCSVCHVSMAKRPLVRLLPCQHLLHQGCYTALQGHGNSDCPLCRQDVVCHENVERRAHRNYAAMDRSRIVQAARELRDWRHLSNSLGVNPKTAWRWVNADQDQAKSRANTTRPKLTETQIADLLEHIESNSAITLQQMKEWIRDEHQIDLHITTIVRYLHSRAFSYKGVHYEPQSMNSPEKKEQRRAYVVKLIELMQEGKFKY